MKRFVLAGVAAAAAVGIGGAPSAAFAQSAAPSSCAAALTDACLLQMLTDMGLSPKALSKGYLVAIKRGTWTVNVQFVLSTNNAKLGMNANLGAVDEAGVTPAQWVNLLIENGNIEPAMFYFDREQKKLYLHRVTDNRYLTPAILRSELDGFVDTIVSTEADWKFTK